MNPCAPCTPDWVIVLVGVVAFLALPAMLLWPYLVPWWVPGSMEARPTPAEPRRRRTPKGGRRG